MDAFHSGAASTMVATDIAARGIHVDDIMLVVHADPPIEHKAYLHRSGRTARAGNDGTVITLMTDDQVRDVRSLTRAAGIHPTMTKINNADHPMLRELAPGDRVLVSGGLPATPVAASRTGGGRSSNGPRNRRGGSPSTQNGSARREGQPARSGARGSGRGRGSGRPAVNRNSSGSTGGHSAATFSRRSRSY
jgi:superfamily II DNA/RNA helicase